MKTSIIITSYNYDKYIEECILSCLNQRNVIDYEVIVVDDGSSDNTIAILNKYKNKIRIFHIENSGIECASNFGILKANGTYVVRIDADDKLHEDFLSKTLPVLENSNLAFVYSEYYIIDSLSKVKCKKEIPKFSVDEIKQRGDFLATGTLYDKSVIDKLGRYSEKNKNCGLENYELILNLICNNYVGKCIHKPLFYYRKHSMNLSKTKRDAIVKYGSQLAKRFDIQQYSTNEYHPYGLIV